MRNRRSADIQAAATTSVQTLNVSSVFGPKVLSLTSASVLMTKRPRGATTRLHQLPNKSR